MKIDDRGNVVKILVFLILGILAIGITTVMVYGKPDESNDCKNLKVTCKPLCKGMKADGYTLVVGFAVESMECFRGNVCQGTPERIFLRSCQVVEDHIVKEDVICTCEWYGEQVAEVKWTPELCGDGIDNDLDELVDCSDRDCCSFGGCEFPPVIVENLD